MVRFIVLPYYYCIAYQTGVILLSDVSGIYERIIFWILYLYFKN